MFEIKSDFLLRIFATLCFLVLLVLQYKLLSSSYKIELREIAKGEKQIIRESYERGITNDKLFPGGQATIDAFFGKEELVMLEQLYKDNHRVFGDSLRSRTDQVVAELSEQSNIDSLLAVILEPLALDLNGYGYALTIDDMTVTFDGKNYVNLFDEHRSLPILVDGDSEYVKPSHLVSAIKVNSHSPYSYEIKFALYGLDLSQHLKVFKKIFPLLALVAICVLVIAGTYIATFSSWRKQKKLNEISQDFLNGITHEFKTPIASISVSVKNLYRETQKYKNGQVSHSIQVIDRQAKQINQLVDQAIGISSFDPSQVNLENHNLTDDLEKAVYDLRLKYIHDHSVSIVLEANEKEIRTDYDLFYFTTAVNNLIENGIKHNNNSEKHVTVRLQDNRETAVLEIIDNGYGIVKDELKNVFQKFYQGKYGKEKGGLGLGLYYADQIVKVHGWQLIIEDESDGGTHVRVIISKN